MKWGSPIEIERYRRIRASLAALQYELRPLDPPYMDEHAFDALCLKINPDMDTGHPAMDEFFATEFSPCTGQWIRSHPELEKLERLHFYLQTPKDKLTYNDLNRRFGFAEEDDPLS